MNTAQEYLSIAVDLVKASLWPLFGLVVIREFKGVITDSLDHSNKMTLKFAGIELEISKEDAAQTLSDYLDATLRLVKPQQRRLFQRLLAYSTPPTVEDVFPAFDHKTSIEELTTLRSLRGAALIRPEPDGFWTPKSLIVITSAGRFVARYKQSILQGDAIVTDKPSA
jgi:hypothetical protein